jgi:hypothetical protein
LNFLSITASIGGGQTSALLDQTITMLATFESGVSANDGVMLIDPQSFDTLTFDLTVDRAASLGGDSLQVGLVADAFPEPASLSLFAFGLVRGQIAIRLSFAFYAHCRLTKAPPSLAGLFFAGPACLDQAMCGRFTHMLSWAEVVELSEILTVAKAKADDRGDGGGDEEVTQSPMRLANVVHLDQSTGAARLKDEMGLAGCPEPGSPCPAAQYARQGRNDRSSAELR